MLGLDFHVISMFRLHRALNKITRRSSLFIEKPLLMEKIKSGRKSLVKRKDTKNRPKRKQGVPFCQEKKTHPL